MIISHRGYANGPDKDRENNPKAILEMIAKEYYVEVDLRIFDGELWLGHDQALHKINEEFLDTYKNSLVIHAKNLATAEALFSTTKYNWFMHDLDLATLTSWNWLWLYPGGYSKKGVVLNFQDPYMFGYEKRECFGICTDYPMKYKTYRESK